jgi:hypothetical protein
VSHTQVSPAASNSATLEGYALQIDGQYTRGGPGPIELPLGCHVVIASNGTWDWNQFGHFSNLYGHYNVPHRRYFMFTAKAGHRYVIERNFWYASNTSTRVGSNATRHEIRTLAELDEHGSLERRYSEVNASEIPPQC